MTCDVRRATCDVRRATCDVRRATCDVRRATCDVRRATCDVRRATCDVRRATCDVRRATCDVRRATCDVRHDVTLVVLRESKRSIGRDNFAVAGPTMWSSDHLQLRQLSGKNSKLIYFACTARLGDTGFCFIALVGFPLFYLKLYLYTLIYLLIILFICRSLFILS